MHILRFYEMQLRMQGSSDATGCQHLTISRIEDLRWLGDFERETYTRSAGRLEHVKGIYKPVQIGPYHYTFPKGCLYELKGNDLRFRNRSEWFPKLISDILFVQTFTPYEEYNITIPKLYVRPEATSVIRRWANLNGYETSRWITETADRMIARYPTIESAIECKRRASRAWLLRYLLLEGRLQPENFQQYRRI